MSSRSPQQAPPRRPLTRERILDAASELIEQDGPGAFSMRRLGNRLGVEGMAIYHHFTGRDDLLGAISTRLLEPLRELKLDADWRRACDAFATKLRAIAVGRPETFRLVGMQPLDESSLAPVERLLAILVGAGFDPGTALAVYRATVSYARGYALAEASGFTVDAAGGSGRERLRTLSAEEFPLLAGRASELASLDADRAFRLGLEALLGGIAGPRAGAETTGPRTA